MPLKAIFFDFDGVLQDSEEIHFQAWLDTLAKEGHVDPSFRFEDVIGESDLKIAERFVHRFRLKDTPESLYVKKLECYRNLIENYEFDTHNEKKVLEELSKDYILGIVSSSHSDDIELFLNEHQLRNFFQFIIGANTIYPHKPHPAPYLLALKNAKVKNSEALVIEDSDPGLTAAHAASLKTIWMNRHNLPPSPIQNSSPPCISFLDLPSLISQFYQGRGS